MSKYGSASPGVDYTLTGVIPSMKSRQRFRFDDLVHVELSIASGYVYQSCRFCSRGWPNIPYLLKYAVRHYVCQDCAKYFAQGARPRG